MDYWKKKIRVKSSRFLLFDKHNKVNIRILKCFAEQVNGITSRVTNMRISWNGQ